MKTEINRCGECGGEMKPRHFYCWEDKFLGKMKVHAGAGEFFFCAECGSVELSYSLMKKIETVEQERIEQLLLRSVGGSMKAYKENLVRNKDLVVLLKKSRQAIQQDHKIKTLIFHHVEKSGEIVYWKPSVDLYDKTGDGRFDLTHHTHSAAKDKPTAKQTRRTETADNFAELTSFTRTGYSLFQERSCQLFPVGSGLDRLEYKNCLLKPGYHTSTKENCDGKQSWG